MTSKHNRALTVTKPLNHQINNQPLFDVISVAYLFRSTEPQLLSSDEQSAVSAPLPSRSGFMLLECSSNRQYHGKSHWLRGVLGRDARPLFRLEQSSLELKHFLTSDLRYSVQWLGSTPPTASFLLSFFSYNHQRSFDLLFVFFLFSVPFRHLTWLNSSSVVWYFSSFSFILILSSPLFPSTLLFCSLSTYFNPLLFSLMLSYTARCRVGRYSVSFFFLKPIQVVLNTLKHHCIILSLDKKVKFVAFLLSYAEEHWE